MNQPSNIIFSDKLTLPDIKTIKSSDSAELIQPYLTDESKIISGKAEKIFFPKSTAEVARIVQEASKGKGPIKITVSGAGTGLTGSRVAQGGWIISTEQIKSVDDKPNEENYEYKDSLTNSTYKINFLRQKDKITAIRVPVGIRLRSLHQLVRQYGYFYPPDTTEWSSFLGGNVATNASGARTFKYGSTRSYVLELKIVLTNGMILKLDREQKTDNSFSWTIIQSDTQEKIIIKVNKSFPQPKVTKNAVAFPIYQNMPLIELFIGTEGVFGIITEILLRLIPQPKNIFSIITYFKNQEQAIQFVRMAQEIKNENVKPIPMSVEFFDTYALQLVSRKYKNIPKETDAAIYLEQDVDDEEDIEKYLDFWNDKIQQTDSIDTWAEIDEKGIEKHKEFRHALPLGVNEIIRSNKVNKVGTDFAVPTDKFAQFLDLQKEFGKKFNEYQNSKALLKPEELSYVTYGHIGNDHLHMNFLPRNKEELHKAEEIYLEMAKEAIKMGGTISAEHGVGKKKYGGKPYIWYMIGDEGINELKKLKKAFDPLNILNRGNLFD